MGREEQQEEREVLESIFPDEIQWISDTEFRITITLDLPPDPDAPPVDEDGNDEGEAPVLVLSVRYPDEYPDKAPALELQPVPNAPTHRHFSVAADREVILRELEATVEENLGMAMVFALVSTAKEAAERLVEERRGAAAREREEAKMAAEREENAKFHGTPVTRETFIKWREGFMREMEEQRQREEEERLEALKKARGPKEPVKLTGKQLWQRGLVGKVVEEEDEDGEEENGVEGMRDGVEGLKV